MSRSLECPRCHGDVEYETERTDNGHDDHTYAVYDVGWVHFTALVWDKRLLDFRRPEREDYTHGITACLCVWTAAELEELHDLATARANDG